MTALLSSSYSLPDHSIAVWSTTTPTPVAIALFPRGGGLDWGQRVNKTRKPPPPKSIWIRIGTLWYKISHPIRYFVSGNLGNVILYSLERVVRLTLEAATTANPPKHLDSISYFTAYLLHIVLQHALHALLVYGLASIDTRQKYWSTLWGIYQTYFVSAFGSTFLNSYLIQAMGVNRDIAFVTTLWIFACLNYLWIGHVVRKANEKAAAAAKPKRKFISKRQQAQIKTTKRILRGGGYDSVLDVAPSSLLSLHPERWSCCNIPDEACP